MPAYKYSLHCPLTLNRQFVHSIVTIYYCVSCHLRELCQHYWLLAFHRLSTHSLPPVISNSRHRFLCEVHVMLTII